MAPLKKFMFQKLRCRSFGFNARHREILPDMQNPGALQNPMVAMPTEASTYNLTKIDSR